MPDTWTTYELWNDAVAEVLFPELEVPEPVYLDFEEDVVDALSVRTGTPPAKVVDELAAAVAATLVHAGPASVFERHMGRMRRWARAGRADVPPFLALLGSFCVAAEQMAAGDGMAANNFFGRLRSVLGWDPADSTLDQGYRRVAERLWGELNRWLVELDGRRGLPTAFALNHRFVGLTVSQALVRSGDRERLKEFFRQYGFAPGADVAPNELKLVLDSWISQRPCPVSSSLERLWRQGQAKDRIAQAAAVALAGWDGSVRERRGREPGTAQRGHLALTLEMGGFPRKRFALQALVYLPQPGTPRDAVVLTATPEATVELVPDLPGSLGLGRGSSLHAGDVLEGMLRLRDSLSGQVLERRPRRLVLFREDELSRRWVESPQVMLGDSVRLLVHEGLVPRLQAVLEAVCRPGWEQLEPFPGQPEGWVVFGGVEVFSHPGDLVSTQRMDDLAPLVPLTSSQLKVAGGFALPGRVRGKWHTWSPPEIRAVSDAQGGFDVRVLDLGRFEEQSGDQVSEALLEAWADDGAGVLVRSMGALELDDGDYRVELVSRGSGETLATTTVLLRSADTPDSRQWSLVEPISYGPGTGVLGLPSTAAEPSVKGLVVLGGSSFEPASLEVPREPQWEVGRRSAARAVDGGVRLTMPDAESCLYTGRHREHIDTVPVDAQGRPREAWSHGRCTGCGLVRRYPTRLKRASFGGRRSAPPDESTPARHDVGTLPSAGGGDAKDWATAFDAILHTGGGSWAQLERIAFQLEPTALFLDQLARTLEVLGQIDVRRRHDTLEPVSWEVAPTALAGTTQGYLFSGYWPASLYAEAGEAVEAAGATLSVEEPDDDLASYYADATRDQLDAVPQVTDGRVVVVDHAWRELAGVLPPLSEVLTSLPRQSESVVGDITWFQPRDGTWAKVASVDAPGAYRIRRFSTLDIVRTDQDVARGTVARSTVQLGKHLAALIAGRPPLMAYDPTAQCLLVPLGADLPGLYGRALVAASGRPPAAVPNRRLLRYDGVPAELASHVYDLLSR